VKRITCIGGRKADESRGKERRPQRSRQRGTRPTKILKRVGANLTLFVGRISSWKGDHIQRQEREGKKSPPLKLGSKKVLQGGAPGEGKKKGLGDSCSERA